eukprot:gnl/MRDRNA2_/MRDRNA2_125099_c0_seq1.p1 gnl/MRDRNA2_/MRDRNA2_125099_c0~~gnl/MRDRNA2_/MRDRNA2_125099_c0_seq1.p1  ORF type:complete len:526 (-),score=84.63 gnl/MRDRNA2_/MRDRNA2_125099_c0_seq1:20-1597(-)
MVDWDDAFAYETKKVVRIRDRRLGLVYYFLLLLILCYVVGFQILYSNEHFKLKDVKGTGRITIQQPVKMCNPNKPDCLSDYSALYTLPYCDSFQGESDEVSAEFRRKCVFADQHSLTPFGMLEGSMLVPSRIDSQVEHRGCQPGDETCDNEFVLDADPEVIYVADIERYTVMFAHSFHRDTMKGNNGQMQGFYYECEVDESQSKSILAMQESIEGPKECKGTMVRKPIDCINDKCPFLKNDKEEKSAFVQKESKKLRKTRYLKGRKVVQGPHNSSINHNLVNRSHNLQTLETMSSQGARNPVVWGQKVPWGTLSTHQGTPDHHGNHRWTSQTHQHLVNTDGEQQPAKRKPPSKPVFAIRDGDIFSIQKILDLVGLDLDKSFNMDGEPLRESGTVIEVEAIYDNLVAFWSSFGYTPVSYTYKFTQRPMEEMKTEMYAQGQPNYPHERVIENRHGLYLMLKVTGTFGFFSIVYLLVMLTTALGLMGVSVVLTDMLAIHFMKHKAEYRDAKYENTKEFEDSQDSANAK